MTIELNFTIVVTGAMTALLVLGMSIAALPVPVIAQSSLGNGGDPTSFLESAKMHLIEATNDLKMGNSQAALTQLNMTHQGIISAERQLNASVICNNVNNEGYCVAP
jgi:chemotaxis response regulator CheB